MAVRRPFTPKGSSERHAVESSRHHNIPLYACIGEIIDNSIEWGADTIRVFVSWKREPDSRPNSVVFVDNGEGMEPGKLANSLVTGFHEQSARADRLIGRFGVGCDYAFLANCRRADVYSKVAGGEWHHTVFDLDAKALDDPTKDYPPDARLKSPPKSLEDHWKRLKSGTITIWKKFDLGHVESEQDEIPFWISRAYRKFIGKNVVACQRKAKEWEANVVKNPKPIKIYYNNELLRPYDPLYAIPYRKGDRGGTLLKPIVMDYPSSDGTTIGQVRILFGLSPAAWRKERKTSAEDPVNLNERFIRGGKQNAWPVGDSRKWSIVRNNREVSWLHDPYLYGRAEDVDRWWGMEIQYDSELDDVFNVQNVKYQVGLSREFRRKLKSEIDSTIRTLRTELSDLFEKTKNEKKKKRKKEEEDENEDPFTELLDDDDLEDVGDTDETPNEFLVKLKANAEERKRIMEALSDRKFVEEEDLTRRVPKDTNLMFEYHAKAGEVLMTKYANHPWFRKMESLEKGIEEKVSEGGEIDLAFLEEQHHEIRILWRILLNTLVISLATVSPNEVQQKIIDKVLSRWGKLALEKTEKREDMEEP